jgi:UDP-glucuronate 4-epimerase
MANSTRPGTALVTGGAGFIGAEVTRQLLDAGQPVRVVDRLDGARQHRAAAELRRAGAEVIVADLAVADLRRLLVGVDRVIHLAGRPGVQPSWGSGFDAYLADNVSVTGRLLDTVAHTGIRVVLASSSSVYGDVASGYAAEDRPVAPVSPYGVTKAAVELLAGTYAGRGVAVVSLRYFTVYGRGQRPDMAISRIVDAARSGTPFFVRGDGHQERDLTHVADAARATVAAAAAELAPGTILNVGSGRPVRLLDVIDEVGRLIGRGVPLAPAPEAVGDPARTAADHGRATALLGWRPRVDLVDGLSDQIATSFLAEGVGG